MNSKAKHNIFFNLQLMLNTKVDITTALSLLIDEVNKITIKATLVDIQDKIVSGMTFSQALDESGKFSKYEVYSVKVGEETGKLAEVIGNLADYYQRRIAQRRKLVSAFSYPLLVIVTAILALGFMLNFVVPMFEDIFKRFDQDLPYLTQLIIGVSESFSLHLLLFLFVVSIIVGVAFYSREKLWFKSLSAKVILATPYLGGLYKSSQFAKLCMIMELLLSSKNPLLNTLTLSREMISFYPVNQALSNCSERIYEGYSLHESMKEHSIFDRRMVSLVKVGEEVNKLDEIFKSLKEQYFQETEYKTGIINAVMEPMLIVFIGLIVGVILIAMYLPLFQLSTTVGF